MMNHMNAWSKLEQRRMSRRRLLGSAALGGAGLAAAAVIGCGGDDEEAASSQPSGGGQTTVKRGSIATSGVGASLSPNYTAGWPSEFFALYDQLARPTFENKMEPGLATKWEQAKPNQW